MTILHDNLYTKRAGKRAVREPIFKPLSLCRERFS